MGEKVNEKYDALLISGFKMVLPGANQHDFQIQKYQNIQGHLRRYNIKSIWTLEQRLSLFLRLLPRLLPREFLINNQER
jgi:hypothetical protein